MTISVAVDLFRYFISMISLAQLLRPKTLDEVVGQRHLLAPDAPFRKMVEQDLVRSIVLYGPAGIGKSCLAQLIADKTKSNFLKLNATTLAVADIRKFMKQKTERKLLLIEEVYRLSRTQSDVLLPFIEEQGLSVVGSTTENPFCTLSSALVSRSQIFQLEPLADKDQAVLLKRGLDHYRSHGKPKLSIEAAAAKHIIRVSSGDGRKCLSILEMAVETNDSDVVNEKLVRAISPNKYMVFDSKGDSHFDYASAYQGSIQASDPDAAVYWLAKWLESGEDPRYIARRLMVSASEDAAGNPLAAAVALSAYISAKEIGRPECDIILSHATILTATSKRDKSAAKAIWVALKDVREDKDVWVPKEMRDCHYQGAEQLGQGSYHDGMNQSKYVGVNKQYFFPTK